MVVHRISLMHVFHILYSVAANKHVSVAECGRMTCGSGNWGGADLYLYGRVLFLHICLI